MTSWPERDMPLEPRSATDKVQPRSTTQTLAVAHDSDLGHDGNQLQQVGESCASIMPWWQLLTITRTP